MKSLKKDKSIIDSALSSKNTVQNNNKNQTQQNSILYTKIDINKTKNGINSQINRTKINLNNINKYSKNLNQISYISEPKTVIENLKKTNHYKTNNSIKKIHTKKSAMNIKIKSNRKDNCIFKFNDHSSKENDKSYNISKEISKNLSLRKVRKYKKSPTQKQISQNPSFIINTPNINNNYINKKKANIIKASGLFNDHSLLTIKKNFQNNVQKLGNNTEIKKKRKNVIYNQKSIKRKKTIGLKNLNKAVINMPLCKSISYDSDKIINKNNISHSNSINNKEKSKVTSHKKNKKEIYNYNYIKKRNIRINNLNNDFLGFNKKIFFSTENNTNYNTNCNSNNNSNNNTLKKRKINKTIICKDKDKENVFKTGKAGKSKSFYRKKTDNSKEVEDKNDRKLSFDIFDTKNSKNSKDILRSICSNLSGNTNTNQNSLIIRFENKQKKKYFDNENSQKYEAINEDNCYQFLNENEQGGNIGINSVKTNNFIINKPKEENLKYSSIKEYYDDNDEQTEISPSQISKIIIGQIEGYNDIMEEDKNINVNDKSRSLMELLSKFSFSNFINSKQSLENMDNLNFFEESNDLKYLKDFNNNWNNISNSKNITNDNMPNLTKIKNVDEEYDSEDLSISVLKNNIKSINIHSNIYLNKLFNKQSNNNSDVNKSKNNNINYKKFVKNSINAENTTVSSGNNNNNNNNNNIVKKVNKDSENMGRNMNKVIYKKISRKLSPGNNIRYNFTQFNNSNRNSIKDKDRGDKAKNNYPNLNKNEKNSLYLKNINRSKILKNKETAPKLNTIKSSLNIYKNLDTNVLFNTNKKNNKKSIIKNINELVFPMNKFPKENKKENDAKICNNSRQEKEEKKLEYANATMSNINGENETIINANFFDIKNEFKEKNEKIDEKNGEENRKNNERCCIY
jgi:hypothetical protein